MAKKLIEDKYYQEGVKATYESLNTDEQRKKGQFYRERYDALKGEMLAREPQWNNIEKQYKCERDYIADAPNSFIPIVAPIINGQIASMVDQNISAKVKGLGPSDQNFASSAQKIIELILKQNKIKQVIKPCVGRYLKFGTGWFAVDWDAETLDGFGLPVIRCPQTTKIFIDGNIKDIVDYQKAQYIIEECGYQSIMFARSEYGDDIANMLMMQTTDSDFDAEKLDDEQFSFMYLKVWHRNNKNSYLQLLEIDDTGLVLRESDSNSPFYEFVNNQYPYYPVGLYQEEGEFHRFGDGQLLYFLQDTINKLYDEILTACKFTSQSRTFVDPDGEMDPDDFDNDPSHPIPCRQPHQNVFVASSGSLNPVVERLISSLINEARRATRFSDLMTGNTPNESITATQAGIQSNQGNTGISDKKGDVSEGLKFIVNYALNMCMELWEGGQWFRITEDSDSFEWIDARQLTKIPILIPTDEEYQNKWMEAHPSSDISNMPQYMQYQPKQAVKNDMGDVVAKAMEGQTKKVSLDIDISIGEGLPTNKLAVYNIILSLAQLQLIDETTGQPRPLIGFTQGRKMIEELIGINFESYIEQNQPMMQQGMQSQQPTQAPINVSPNIPGANMNGTMMKGGLV